jgi:Mg2+/Co2+ transporter CorC
MNDTFTKNEIKELIKDFKHDFFLAEETETFYQDVLNYALTMAKDLVAPKEKIVKVFTNPKTRMILTTATTLAMNTTEEARFIAGDAFCQMLISLNDLA